MAIPIVFPNSEEAEDSYRSLDLLLEQLLITLRQVLMHRRREAAANAYLQTVRHRLIQSDATAVEETSEQLERTEESRRGLHEETACAHPNLPLPDVVLQSTQESSTSHEEQKESERTSTVVRNVERSETTSSSTTTTTTTTTTNTGQTHSWVQVGGDLKRIDEQIVATNRLDQKEDKKGKIKDDKETSLLSLLCPPLGSSVWTTVVLLVGWGLISRTR